MARPCTIDTNEILEVARELFLKRGLDVPTAEIARRAGVSEGSIFKRFPTKQALFVAAMGLEQPEWIKPLPGRVGQGDVRENLKLAICEGIAFFRSHLPRIMMLWSSRAAPASPGHLLDRIGPDRGPRRVLKALTDYVAQEMKLGRLRADSAEVTARALLGSIANFAFLETLGGKDGKALDAETYAEMFVDMLWRGVAPPPQQDNGG